jgi:hypothetical protein
MRKSDRNKVIPLPPFLGVSFYHISFSEFLVLTKNIPKMIFSEMRRSQKSCDAYGIQSSGNLPTLEKCRYINGMLPCPGHSTRSEDCGRSGRGEGGLSCKARGPKVMLSSCHCCVSFCIEWCSLNLNHHHHRFASLTSVFNCCAIWYYYCFCSFIICCYSLYTYIKVFLCRVLLSKSLLARL